MAAGPSPRAYIQARPQTGIPKRRPPGVGWDGPAGNLTEPVGLLDFEQSMIPDSSIGRASGC